MKRLVFLPFCLTMSCFPWAAGAQDLKAWAETAFAGDLSAVQSLRRSGPAGLQVLLEKAAPQIAELRQNKLRLEAEAVQPLRSAVDGVAGQRDAWASGLYWFTDLEAAKAEAVKTGRPILSLRLLGNLDEEFCCANSRFFRTVLYANTTVAEHLRSHYVLHWKSVRPAPLLTIDMGDGRRIKRTITGNSIHYLLDQDGRVLDALPGIYSPAAFLRALGDAGANLTGKSRKEVQAWHGREVHSLCIEWLAAAVKAGVYDETLRTSLKNSGQAASSPGGLCLNKHFLPAVLALGQSLFCPQSRP